MNIIENKVKIGKKWFSRIKKINPEDYMDSNALAIVKQIKTDLQPVSEEGGTEGEYDCFALFEGKVGMGKSNAANLFCLAIDPTFTPERCIYRDFNYWTIKKKLTKDLDKDIDAARMKAISFDELRRVLHSKDSMRTDSIAIEKDLGDIRALGLFIGACIDDPKSIMRYIRETRIDIWFYCQRRGIILVYKLYTTSKDDKFAEMRIAKIKKMLMQGIHPHTPYKIRLKAIPHNSDFWINFKRREMRYKGAAKESKENIKLMKIDEKVERLLTTTCTLSEAARRLKTSRSTILRLAKKRKSAMPKRIKERDISWQIWKI